MLCCTDPFAMKNNLYQSYAVAYRSLSGCNAEMALNILKNAVTKTAGFLYIARLEREAQALSRGIRFVNRHMAPPYAAVVPQVVVEVIIVNTKRDFCLLRCHCMEMLETKM